MTPAQQIADNIRREFDAIGITESQRQAICVFMAIGHGLPDEVELPPWLEVYRQFEKKINGRLAA